MKKAELAKANRLAAMANELPGIKYAVDQTEAPKREGGSVWFPMTATADDGRTWAYWLAADSGSYKGSFFDAGQFPGLYS